MQKLGGAGMSTSRPEAAFDQLYRTFTSLDRAHERWLADAGSNGARAAIIAALAAQQGAITPATISQVTGRSANAVSPLLRGLEADGLIKRLPHPTDQRSHFIRLTAAGRRSAQRLQKEERVFVRASLTACSAKELDALQRALRLLEERTAPLQRDR